MAPAFALTYFDGASVSDDTIPCAAGLGAAYSWVVLLRVGALSALSTATITRRTGALRGWGTR